MARPPRPVGALSSGSGQVRNLMLGAKNSALIPGADYLERARLDPPRSVCPRMAVGS